MAVSLVPLLSDSYLRRCWNADFEAFEASPAALDLLGRLRNWAGKPFQPESEASGAFVGVFFKGLWGHVAAGEQAAGTRFTCWPEFPVRHAGPTGSIGKADLALGFFEPGSADPIPQVLCEFKDVHSGLDTPRLRKGHSRSPVAQAFAYLREAREGRAGPFRPNWALVTDMNEFRLYAFGRPDQCLRFVLRRAAGQEAVTLLDDTPEAAFHRFVFQRVFRPEMLLTTGETSPLGAMLQGQVLHEREIEDGFYREYSAYRESVYRAMVAANPGFQGSRHRMVRLAQRFLDRCIFLLFCEDMGTRLHFPPNLLRDLLCKESTDPDYVPDDNDVWLKVRRLFASMRDGTPFRDHAINRFNGGLFALQPDLENLVIPSRVFCARNQGVSDAALAAHPDTLLYLAARYNFGAAEGGDRVIDLYTLGRIFEQSITDLEVLEAQAAGKPSLAELSKRKRDGVYYTPEWVTARIVRDTIGARLEDLRGEVGLAAYGEIAEDEAALFRGLVESRRKKHRLAGYLKALDAYSWKVDCIRILDPACGSGAFLIQAFRFLYDERRRIAAERERLTGHFALWDSHEVMRQVLSMNLYGVDINPESVEITRLALWLHTALADQPLTSLDHNIRCGNSLVGPEYWTGRGTEPSLLPEYEREAVNAFDWRGAFPEAADGFDCVVGNPPYVKLQHFRAVHPDVAVWLVQARRADGTPRYRSTQTGNFDLYLPFIEKGLELLRPGGRMGFIAPSLWTVNAYGEGLRCLVREGGHLDTWIDFKSFQVFREATTYTALQFFTRDRKDELTCVLAPEGPSQMDNPKPELGCGPLPYEGLAPSGAWLLVNSDAGNLVRRLLHAHRPLSEAAEGIIVGIQTSADAVYVLRKVSPGRYRDCRGTIVEIEDPIMRPLVMGSDTRRYVSPEVTSFLLFPYHGSAGVRLLSEGELGSRLPKALRYLRENEEMLRAREGRKMDRDDTWWAYNYPKNLDKQELPKLLVAETVPSLRVVFDVEGRLYLNNVRVNGILPRTLDDGWFLLGVLNAPVADFVFHRIAKPKSGGYFEANKQFIAPLPIPDAAPAERAEVCRLAKQLQEMHTRRRDVVQGIERRLASPQAEADDREASWLWADVKPARTLAREAPPGCAASPWAREERQRRLLQRLAEVGRGLREGAALEVGGTSEELVLLAGGAPVLRRFVDPAAAPLLRVQWRQFVRSNPIVTPSLSPQRLVDGLLRLRRTDDPDLARQILDLDREAQALELGIAETEAGMNDLVYRLYALTPGERQLVESDRQCQRE